MTTLVRTETHFYVMPGLVPGIHVLRLGRHQDVDGRVKPGHDERDGLLSRRASWQFAGLCQKHRVLP
jgi:hypothetical protein